MADKSEEDEGLTKKKSKVLLAAVLAVFVIAAVFFAAFAVFGTKAQEGSKYITIVVTDDQGVNTIYKHHTDAEFLLDVISELSGLEIEGIQGEYGLYITSINGIRADYEEDHAYWAIYVNGQYGMYGIELQPVADGDEYSFVYEDAVLPVE